MSTSTNAIIAFGFDLGEELPEAWAREDGFEFTEWAEVVRISAECEKLRADAEKYRWLEENGTLSLKRIPSYGQKWAELRFPWVGDPFADRHKTLGDAIRAALATPTQGEKS